MSYVFNIQSQKWKKEKKIYWQQTYYIHKKRIHNLQSTWHRHQFSLDYSENKTDVLCTEFLNCVVKHCQFFRTTKVVQLLLGLGG